MIGNKNHQRTEVLFKKLVNNICSLFYEDHFTGTQAVFCTRALPDFPATYYIQEIIMFRPYFCSGFVCHTFVFQKKKIIKLKLFKKTVAAYKFQQVKHYTSMSDKITAFPLFNLLTSFVAFQFSLCYEAINSFVTGCLEVFTKDLSSINLMSSSLNFWRSSKN